MADRFDISVLGDKELERKLRELTDKAERKVIRQALRKAGQVVLRDAKRNAPVRTGKLRRSLKLRANKRSRRFLGVHVRTGTREELGIAPDNPYYYPAAVELGLRDGKTRRGRRFMRDALDNNRKSSMDLLRREIGLGIEREASR